MKAISISKSSLRSSSFLNTVTYLSRSSKLATAAKKDHMVQLDRTIKFRRATDWMGRPMAWTDSEVDRLQYCLAYSNSEQYCSEDLLYLSHEYKIKAENLKEKARALTTRISYLEQDIVHKELAFLMNEEATNLNEEATNLNEKADFFHSEAIRLAYEEEYISRWEEIYDMM